MFSKNIKIEKAIKFATKVHKGQTRKGKTIVYITHPIAVGELIASVSSDEDLLCAGILHDTIEDCVPYGSVTKEIIKVEFGGRVAKIVDDLTEQDKNMPWAERKKLALEHVEHMNHDSLLVKSADVLHNLEDQIADYQKEGDAMFERFNAPKKAQLERYEKLITAIGKKWPLNPLLGKLEVNLAVVKQLWG